MPDIKNAMNLFTIRSREKKSSMGMIIANIYGVLAVC